MKVLPVQALALERREFIFRTILIGERDVAAPVGEVLPVGGREAAFTGVAAARNAALPMYGQAVKVLLENEVDDAADAIGTVDRRYATGEHVNPLEEVGWNGVDIDGSCARLARYVPPPVDQHERALRAEVTQIEQVEPGFTDGVTAGSNGRRLRPDQRRILREKVGEIGDTRILERVLIERDDRIRRIELRASDTAARDHDEIARVPRPPTSDQAPLTKTAGCRRNQEAEMTPSVQDHLRARGIMAHIRCSTRGRILRKRGCCRE